MLSPERKKDLLFPFPEVRKTQNEMLVQVEKAVKEGRCIIVHAPTGLGKTVSALAPALAAAKDSGKTVFFLTSRHTQHQIAIETLRAIKDAHSTTIKSSDIIGKRHMCLQPGIEALGSSEFVEYCRAIRKEGTCPFYANTRDKELNPSPTSKIAVESLHEQGPSQVSDIMDQAAASQLCPYELATMMADGAEVIIADYNYAFNPSIRDGFFARANKHLTDAILIIDEGHNLPSRMRELASTRLTSYILDRAKSEAKKNRFDDAIEKVRNVEKALETLAKNTEPGGETLVERDRFIELVAGKLDAYEELTADLTFLGDAVRAKARQSFLGSIGAFLEAWKGPDYGFVRIIQASTFRDHPSYSLAYRCLDPSVVTRAPLAEAHAAIIMSGTLMPTEMYGDILGVPDDTIYREYDNPFPEDNRLSLIVPATTTKFSMRSPEQYDQIAAHCVKITEAVSGNVLVFFPSYSILNEVHQRMAKTGKKTMFCERQGLTKEDKFALLESFKGYKESGAVLLAVSSANYAEGIDLPGDLLKGVVVVGLPLQRPDLETKKLIEHYDEKFQRGWDYGYVFPAFNRTLQNAGRCIRSETDKGVIIFLDERYAWPTYRRYFPPDHELSVTLQYERLIGEFFKKN
ncbi:MAG: ATP-dependent DNA helicase [archaeon]